MSGVARRPSQAALARISRLYTPQVVQQLSDIEKDLGGRASLIGMLVLAPLNADLQYVLGMLGDPQHQQTSLADICGLGNIYPGDLLKHLAAAALLRGKVLASQQIGMGIAAVAADVMRRAAPYHDACSSCLGTGTYTPEPSPDQPNPAPGPCDTCKGSGQLLYRPDLERQKLAVDLAHLLPKSGGIQIAQINAGAGASPPPGGGVSTFDAVQRVVDTVLYGKGAEEGLDAEILPEATPEEADPPDPAESPDV